MTEQEEVMPGGRRLIDAWHDATQRLENSQRAITAAKNELAEATRKLGAWLLPEDAKPGEKIAVWDGDWLIQAEVAPLGAPPYITVRKRGRPRI